MGESVGPPRGTSRPGLLKITKRPLLGDIFWSLDSTTILVFSSVFFNMYLKPVFGYLFHTKMVPWPPFGMPFGTIWDTLRSKVGKVKTVLPPAREHGNQALEDTRFLSCFVFFCTVRLGIPFSQFAYPFDHILHIWVPIWAPFRTIFCN